MSQTVVELVLIFFALLVAIDIHEFAHAWSANRLGDNTAEQAGRITLNPFVHLDPIGTLMIFLARIGWGKPVPVNPNNFKNPKVGWALVSLAGPTSNLLLAFVFSLAFHFTLGRENLFSLLIFYIIVLNIVLGIFNLIPIPPLDGSRILFAFLPPTVDIAKIEALGPMVLITFILLDRFLNLGIFFGFINTALNFFLNLFQIPGMLI